MVPVIELAISVSYLIWAVGNVSGNRCESDCRSRGREFDPWSHTLVEIDHTLVEIDHEIISTVILLPSAESFKKGCYQLQAKVWLGELTAPP